MNISELQRLRSGFTDGILPQPGDIRRPTTSSFGDTLAKAIHEVDGSQKAADQQIEAFVAGEQENLHEVMISMNEAKLTFQLMTEVRNKML